MKKIFALILALAMVLTLAACGGSNKPDAPAETPAPDASAEAPAETPAPDASAPADAGRTELKVGFDAAFPPYGYLDEATGDYIGFDLSLAQAVCDYYGWTLVKQPIDWDSKDMELNAGTIDCIWNGFTINGREDEYTWSDPYVDNSQVIIVKADSGIASIADLAGKIVDVQTDSSALAAIQGEDATEAGAAIASSVAQLTQVADYNTAFMDLDAGACDAIALDVGVANFQLGNRNGGYAILDEAIASEQYGIGFKKGNEELRDQVMDALLEMVGDGSVTDIIDEWATMDDGAYSFLTDAWCLAVG